MKKNNLTAIFFLISMEMVFAQHVIRFVDPFICTGGEHGQLEPSVTVPLGMIKGVELGRNC